MQTPPKRRSSGKANDDEDARLSHDSQDDAKIERIYRRLLPAMNNLNESQKVEPPMNNDVVIVAGEQSAMFDA